MSETFDTEIAGPVIFRHYVPVKIIPIRRDGLRKRVFGSSLSLE